jgi:Na+/melibiose symporter-like transporter
MFSAVGGFVTKLAASSTTVLTGYMLFFAGYSEGSTPSDQTIVNMRKMLMLVPAGLAFASSLLTLAFPITRRRANQIRRILELRRGRLIQVELGK